MKSLRVSGNDRGPHCGRTFNKEVACVRQNCLDQNPLSGSHIMDTYEDRLH